MGRRHAIPVSIHTEGLLRVIGYSQVLLSKCKQKSREASQMPGECAYKKFSSCAYKLWSGGGRCVERIGLVGAELRKGIQIVVVVKYV